MDRGGAVRGLPESLMDPERKTKNSRLLKTYLMLDYGKALIGAMIGLIVMLFVIYSLQTHTYHGFLDYISKDVWLIPGAVGGLGFIIIILAGILHRHIRSEM